MRNTGRKLAQNAANAITLLPVRDDGALVAAMRRAALLWLLFALTGCSSKPPPPPPPPTKLLVHVLDATNDAPVANAQLVLIEEGKTRTTTASGSLVFEIAPGLYTYRVQAPKYLIAPLAGHAARHMLAVEHKTSEHTVRLEPRPMASDGGTLAGRVARQGSGVGGVLVVATAIESYSAYTDSDGKFAISALPAGLYQVSAFLGGHQSTSASNVNIANAMTAKMDVDLELTAMAGATVGGKLTGPAGTSTISLVHPATGDVIPGLHTAAMIGQTFSITGAPPGSFDVRAGLEDDGLILDPDAVLRKGEPMVDVTDTTSKTVDLAFVAGVHGIMPSTTSTIAAPPMFSWSAVQGADFYVVEVRDVSGKVIWGGFDAFKNPRMKILTPMTSVAYGGDPLARGALYSWRVYAGQNVTTGQLFVLLSASEDLGGLFRIAR
jgi:carboxypeptidase family protein